VSLQPEVQRPTENATAASAAPSAEHPDHAAAAAPNAPGPPGGKCGAGPHATDPARCAKGHALVRNGLAITTAFDAQALPPSLALLDHDVEQFVSGCLVDEADDDLPTRRRALLGYRARVHRRILMLDSALELRGLVDRRGRLRAQWLQRLEGLIGVARALDAQLGLERRAKRAPMQEYLEHRAAANATAETSDRDAVVED